MNYPQKYCKYKAIFCEVEFLLNTAAFVLNIKNSFKILIINGDLDVSFS
jgi:hypothetical protein